jgi:hypothetical protein
MPTLAEHVARVPQAPLDLARVLIVHDDLAPRLTLRTLLEAGGYAVDMAGTPAEAMAKLDKRSYELVLSACADELDPIRGDLLTYARVKEYRPATARIIFDESPGCKTGYRPNSFAVHTEDVPLLLGKVADLIAHRASRRYRPSR